MSLKITRVGPDSFHCVSYDESGAVEWETPEPMAAGALAQHLAKSLGYDQIDVYSELIRADPARGASIIERNIVEIEKLLEKQGANTKKANPQALALLEAWLKVQQSKE